MVKKTDNTRRTDSRRRAAQKSMHQILCELFPDPMIESDPRSEEEIANATDKLKVSLQRVSENYLKGGFVRTKELVPNKEMLLFAFTLSGFGLSIKDAIWVLDEIDDEYIKFRSYAAVYQVALASLKLGYFIKAAPLTEAKADLGRLGGRRSGEARAQVAAKTWQPHALELAKESRAINPGLSQDALAEHICSSWKLEDPKAPGHATLKKFVSGKIKSGELPERMQIANRFT